jgi:hypothetical protein
MFGHPGKQNAEAQIELSGRLGIADSTALPPLACASMNVMRPRRFTTHST